MSFSSDKYANFSIYFSFLHPDDDYWDRKIHVHALEELLLIGTPGCCTVVSNGNTCQIPTPAFIWNRAGSYHIVKDADITEPSFLAAFHPQILADIPKNLRHDAFMKDLSLFALPLTASRSERLASLFKVMLKSPVPQRQLMLPCVFHQISQYLKTGTEPICTANTFGYILEVVALLQQSYREKLTIEDLADRFHVGQTKLKNDFKKITNQSIHAFQLRAQLQSARSLLVTTEYSLGQIAMECGFTDQSHLIRAFRSEYGKTPGAFRKGCKTSPRWSN